ncbi:conserved hypothetical protein [Parafrankia sp. EUN1f]|nr:conserved hypothetical protein [Parafrankia sp. EUN1f]
MAYRKSTRFPLLIAAAALGSTLSAAPALAAPASPPPDRVPTAAGCYWRHVSGHWVWAAGHRRWVPPRSVWVCGRG